MLRNPTPGQSTACLSHGAGDASSNPTPMAVDRIGPGRFRQTERDDGAPLNNWPIFICFRQDDGKAAAARVHHVLKDLPVPKPTGADSELEPARLDVRFEQDVPEGGDWETLHEPNLRRAMALVIVCSPGIKHPVGQNDWADRDIAWWLDNRDISPILVDPLGTDARWVPQSIAEKWPDANPIRMVEGEWDTPDGAQRSASEEQTREQLLGAILAIENGGQGRSEHDPNKLQELKKSLDEQRQLSEQLQASLADQQQTSQKLRASLNQQKQTASELQSVLGAQQTRSRQWRWAFGVASLLLAAKFAAGLFVPL